MSTPPPPINWVAFVAELEALAEASLGNRSQKVKDVLAAADKSEAGIAAAIEQISRMTLVFVDPFRLSDLADDMKGRLAGLTGKPRPPRRSAAPTRLEALDVVTPAGCLGNTLLCFVMVIALIFIRDVTLP